MPQQLFSLPKMPIFCDGYAPSLEKRKGEDVKILTLALRLQIFDTKHATSLDDGLNNQSGVKAALFNLSNGEPKAHLRRVEFNLACPRQNLIVFASTDTEMSRMAFLQTKITGTYARIQKDVTGWAFCFKASFGPVGRDEQEFVHEWMLSQRAVSFEESEPTMALGEDESEDDDDQAAESEQPELVDAARTVPKRGSRKRKKVDHDGERAAQVEAGKATAH